MQCVLEEKASKGIFLDLQERFVQDRLYALLSRSKSLLPSILEPNSIYI